MRLYLVRHGQTAWNNSGRAQGHTDISLDPEGLEQAAKLAVAFEGVIVDRVLSSDLARSVETATPLAKAVGAPLNLNKDFRERCFGEWEGLMFSEVTARLNERAKAMGITNQEVRPPGGESFLDVWKRLDSVYEMLAASDDTTVVVSHGGALSLLLAKLIKGTLDTCRTFRFANTGVTELQRRPDGLFLMVRYSDSSHLGSSKVLSGNIDGIAR
jgi:broad specificity phosphatase PhoE